MVRNIISSEMQAHLLAREAVFWAGRPGQGLLFTAQDAVIIPFSLVWGGMAAFVFGFNMRHGAPAAFSIVSIPFVLVALYLFAGRFLLDARLRRDTEYAITGHRVLILRQGWWPMVRAINLDRLADNHLTERSGGRGTITFGSGTPVFGAFNRNLGFGIASLDPVPRLLAIDDVRQVFALIQDRSRDRLDA